MGKTIKNLDYLVERGKFIHPEFLKSLYNEEEKTFNLPKVNTFQDLIDSFIFIYGIHPGFICFELKETKEKLSKNGKLKRKLDILNNIEEETIKYGFILKLKPFIKEENYLFYENAMNLPIFGKQIRGAIKQKFENEFIKHFKLKQYTSIGMYIKSIHNSFCKSIFNFDKIKIEYCESYFYFFNNNEKDKIMNLYLNYEKNKHFEIFQNYYKGNNFKIESTKENRSILLDLQKQYYKFLSKKLNIKETNSEVQVLLPNYDYFEFSQYKKIREQFDNKPIKRVLRF